MNDITSVKPDETGAVVEPWLREILRCPVTKTELEDALDAAGNPVYVSVGVDAERGGRLQYPIRDGIPVLLADDATVIPA